MHRQNLSGQAKFSSLSGAEIYSLKIYPLLHLEGMELGTIPQLQKAPIIGL